MMDLTHFELLGHFALLLENRGRVRNAIGGHFVGDQRV